MKKVIVSAAALFCGAMMFAQTDINHPDREEASAGTNNSGDPNANMADVDQWNTSQKAFVDQIGVRNSADVTQKDGAFGGIGENQAYIRQSGPDYWGVYSLAADNQAEANQAGTRNETSLIQRGTNNDARSDQGMDGLAKDNKVLIYQGEYGDLNDGSDAFAKQEGIENSSKIWQQDNNNDAMTIQDGDDNKAYVKQQSRQDGSVDEGQLALVEQYGNGNESTVDQEGDGARNNAYTEQQGDHNKAWQKQNNSSGDAFDQNTATITQGSLSYKDSDYAIAIQDQEGEDHNATITQYGGNSFGSNYAEQIQDGDDNDANITQDHKNGNGDNFAKQIQYGKKNYAEIEQQGNGHKAQQEQYGDHNEANSFQKGIDHTAYVWQKGNHNFADTDQFGVGNDALVVQKNGQSAKVYQNGTGNEATVFQSGPYGLPSYAPETCEFDSPIGTPTVPTPGDINLPDPCPNGGC